ncbi:hypothetical protein FH972_025215 [Carpinus fangiana]|uniref:Clathrin light chain n=1 Tax=Carpinus fangiana TaxID=176857 RepID=A0A5N6L0D2_9ROSI|nr:hypothetical protein FH972_025215 [Carpinus fangiana]
MADRFPSIEDFNEGDTQGVPDAQTNDGDDFLARERAALGDDADLFTGADDADLLGGGDTNGDADVSQFKSNFPAVDAGSNERVAPGGSITGTATTLKARGASPAPFPTGDEPAVIKEWRERRDLAISAREEKAAQRKAETIKGARTAIDEFYENYNNKTEKGRTQTAREAEEFLAKREDTTAGGTSWERIAKLVDLKGGKIAGAAPGKERFREMLGSLVKDENAPGAKGY